MRFNIDRLYNDPNLRKLFQPKYQNSKDIEVLLQFKNEYRRKEIFEQKILQFLIVKLDKRRKRLMEKAMQDILKNIDISNDYV